MLLSMSKALGTLTFTIVFLIGCVEEPNSFSIPSDMATTLEHQQIQQIVLDLEQNFKTIGLEINLNKIPIIVTDTISGDGKCMQAENSQNILIHKRLFKSENLDPNLNQISRLWSVIAHEIGHCYFGRTHEEKNIFPYSGFVFQSINKIRTQDTYLCFNVFTQVWPGTLMGAQGLSVVPQGLKTFYLKELIGRLNHPQIDDILQTKDIVLVNEVEALGSWQSTTCF